LIIKKNPKAIARVWRERIVSYRLGRLAGLFIVILFAPEGIAEAFGETNNDGSGAERVINAYRLGDGETVTIDGRLDEPFWSRVDVATEFRTIDPVEDGDPAQPTRVRIAYDSETLYVAWEIVETRPGHVRASVRERDGPIGVDDWVRVYLDPFRSGRDSYNFELNAYGSRFDGLIENNLTERGEWDAVWQARVHRHDQGWTAEMAIPFRNLAYPSDGSDWGIDFSRVIQRDFEVHRWAQHDRSFGLNNLSHIGRLRGVEGIDRGMGLEIEAYGTSRHTHVWEEPGQEDDLIASASGNAYYKVTDSLTGTLTVNTDFSDTPLDPRIVSTSRFATFFNETRDFFLQDSAIFEFGGRGFSDGANGRPFFSRRIGLVDGQVIDLMGGAKLSGRWRGHDVGALVTYMDEGRDFDRQVLGVARMSHPFTQNTKLGGIFTFGDPNGETENYVGGLDFQWAAPLEGGGQRSAEIYALNSYTDGGIGHGQAWGGVFRHTTDPLFVQFRTKHLEEGYNPELGFVNRPETRYFQLNGRRRWRPEDTIFRNVDFWQWNEFTTDLDYAIESVNIGASLEGNFTSSDYYGMFLEYRYERVNDPFTLPGGPVVAAGEYEYPRAGFWIGATDSRVWSPHFELNYNGFFGGEEIVVDANIDWRPSPVFAIGWTNDWRAISVDSGDTEIYVTSIAGIISFTPDMQLSTEVQYDNISGNVNLFSRFNWEFAPGSELFIGVGHNADVPASDFGQEFTSNVSTVTVRVGRTFNF
jgi:hypothetical protein